MKNKILFINHGINKTGFGQVTEVMLKALSSEFDVVSRIIPLEASEASMWHKKLLDKDLNDVTHVIQYVLPQYFARFPNVKNIGVTEQEFTNLNFCEWLENYEMMDSIWVSNEDMQKELSGLVSVPVEFVFHPLDERVYEFEYEKFIDTSKIDGTYKFYNISTFTRRKNVASLIKAFHVEFDPSEPVSLVLKSSEDISPLCEMIKQTLDLYPKISDYHSELIIDMELSNNQINNIHQMCDCYVSTSVGESFGKPLFDSQGFKNVCIASNTGGHKLLGNTVGGIKDYSPGGVSFKHLGNARTICESPSTLELCRKMREAYEGKLSPIDITKFNFKNFINRVKEVI